jgi:hypothetical protein
MAAATSGPRPARRRWRSYSLALLAVPALDRRSGSPSWWRHTGRPDLGAPLGSELVALAGYLAATSTASAAI